MNGPTDEDTRPDICQECKHPNNQHYSFCTEFTLHKAENETDSLKSMSGEPNHWVRPYKEAERLLIGCDYSEIETKVIAQMRIDGLLVDDLEEDLTPEEIEKRKTDVSTWFKNLYVYSKSDDELKKHPEFEHTMSGRFTSYRKEGSPVSTLSVTKMFKFCYAHNLPDYVGKCRNIHGHNSNVEVEVARSEDQPIIQYHSHTDKLHSDETYPGMVIDFKDLKKIVEPILEELDHQNLNRVFEAGSFMPPTAENITQYIVQCINSLLPKGVVLVRVRVSETDDSYAEWKA